MSEGLKSLRENTDRRFAILMTALQDFMGALNVERKEMLALLDVQEKAVEKQTQTQTVQPVEKPKKRNKPST